MKIAGVAHVLRDPRVITAVNAVVAVLVVLSALLLVRDVLSLSFSAREKVVRSGGKGPVASRHELAYYADVLKNNPFGFPAGELKTISSQEAGAVRQTDVTLIGTVAGAKKVSYAIFLSDTGKQEIFRAGEKVYGLGVLRKIEKSKVIIKANARDIEIPLADVTVVREVKGAGTPAGGIGRQTGESSYQVDLQKIQQAIERPDQIMTDARFIPNIVDGRQQGFILSEVKPGGIYQSLGLRNGDVLLRINEYAITNPETALQAFTALRSIDRAQLDVMRGGSKMTLTYQIR